MSAQGEKPFKVQEAIKKLGYPAKPADIVKIKESLKDSAAPAPPIEPSDEQKRNIRINELIQSGRRDLEAIARDLGFEPTKEQYPDKLSLAKAIAEKEVLE